MKFCGNMYACPTSEKKSERIIRLIQWIMLANWKALVTVERRTKKSIWEGVGRRADWGAHWSIVICDFGLHNQNPLVIFSPINPQHQLQCPKPLISLCTHSHQMAHISDYLTALDYNNLKWLEVTLAGHRWGCVIVGSLSPLDVTFHPSHYCLFFMPIFFSAIQIVIIYIQKLYDKWRNPQWQRAPTGPFFFPRVGSHKSGNYPFVSVQSWLW